MYLKHFSTKVFLSALCALPLMAVNHAGAQDLVFENAKGKQIEAASSYVVEISCARNKIVKNRREQTIQPADYLSHLDRNGAYSLGSVILSAKRAAVFLSFGQSPVSIDGDYVGTVDSDKLNASIDGIDAFSMPLFLLRDDHGAYSDIVNEGICNQTYMVTGRSAGELPIIATLMSSTVTTPDDDPVKPVVSFLEAGLVHGSRFFTKTSLLGGIFERLTDVDDNDDTVVSDEFNDIKSLSEAWSTLVAWFGRPALVKRDTVLREGDTILRNSFMNVRIRVTKVSSFIHSSAPMTANAEDLFPELPDGQETWFSNSTLVRSPAPLHKEESETFRGECEAVVDGLIKKGVTSKQDQAYVLARLLSEAGLSRREASVRCFHHVGLVDEMVTLQRIGADYVPKHLVNSDEILFNRQEYEATFLELADLSNPESLAVAGLASDAHAEEAESLFGDVSGFWKTLVLQRQTDTPSSYSRFNDAFDETVIFRDQVGILPGEQPETGLALHDALAAKGYQRAGCHFANTQANVEKLGEEYFPAGVGIVFLVHRLPADLDQRDVRYDPEKAIVMQASVHPRMFKFFRLTATDLDPERLFTGNTSCARHRVEEVGIPTLAEQLDLFLNDYALVMRDGIRSGRLFDRFAGLMSASIGLVDGSHKILGDSALMEGRDQVIEAISSSAFTNAACGVLKGEQTDIPSFYFGPANSVFIINSSPDMQVETAAVMRATFDADLGTFSELRVLGFDPAPFYKAEGESLCGAAD